MRRHAKISERKFGRRLARRLAPAPVAVTRQAIEEAVRILEGIGFCHLLLPELAEERARKILAVQGFRNHADPIELASVA